MAPVRECSTSLAIKRLYKRQEQLTLCSSSFDTLIVLPLRSSIALMRGSTLRLGGYGVNVCNEVQELLHSNRYSEFMVVFGNYCATVPCHFTQTPPPDWLFALEFMFWFRFGISRSLLAFSSLSQMCVSAMSKKGRLQYYKFLTRCRRW